MTYDLNFSVRASDLDENGNFSLHSFFLWYNEIGMRHDDSEGHSWKENHNMGFSWILYRWKAQFFKNVQEGETIRLSTWVSKMESFMTYREYEMKNEQDEVVARAVCVCSAMSVESRMLTRIPKSIRASYPLENTSYFSDLPKIKDVTVFEPDFEKGIEIRYQDIDVNTHVNNLVYIDWVWDLLPASYRRDKKILEFDIVYRHEIRGEKRVTLHAKRIDEKAEELGVKILSEDLKTEYAMIILKFAV